MGFSFNSHFLDLKSVKYYTTNSSPAFYIKDFSSSFVFIHYDTIPSTLDTLQRIDVTYDKVNAAAKTYPMEERSDYLNYFLPQCHSGGITKVHGNQRLITTDLYPSIDLMYSSNQNGIKYYYIIKPGGNPTNIRLTYTGATSFNLNSTTNVLTINSSIGSISYERPTVYQIDVSNNIIPITGWTADWQTNGASNRYKFNIGAYDNHLPLIIQVDRGHSITTPVVQGNLFWSTYIGSPQPGDKGSGVVMDNNNNIFTTGGAYGGTSFPITAGVYQNYVKDFGDIYVVKFSGSTQFQIWGTYIGGYYDDWGSDLAIDNSGNIIILGNSSSDDFPTSCISTGGHFCQATNVFNDLDRVICKLSPNGQQLLYSTYFGGSGDDFDNYGAHLKLDNSGNIYIAGTTLSSDLPTKPHITNSNAYNDATFNGGGTDGYLSVFTNDFVWKWCTYIGGTGADAINSIELDDNNNIYLCGETTSLPGSPVCLVPTNNGFPLCNPGTGYYQNFKAANSTAFITEFDNSGNLQWSTFFGGNGGERACVIKYLPDLLFVVGSTTTQLGNTDPLTACNVPSNGTFPTCNPGTPDYYHINFGLSDIFISKFISQSKQLVWSTFYGGDSYDNPTAITSDRYNNVYIAGSTNSNDFLHRSLPGYYYNDTHSDQTETTEDPFIIKINPQNNVLWSTYFGGSNTNPTWGFGEIIHSMAASTNASPPFSDRLCATGTTYSMNFPYYCTFPPQYCHHPTSISDLQDGFMSLFEISPNTGIDEQYNKTDLIFIYPNPCTNLINVVFENQHNKKTEIKILDILSRVIWSETSENSDATTSKTIDVSSLPRGLYFIFVINDNISLSGKFLKQ